MKDFLQDLVAHTHSLGVISMVKVTNTEGSTLIESRADDRSVVMTAVPKNSLSDFTGVFGMPNLNKLDIHLKCPEYKENAVITVISKDRNGEPVPEELHFKNAAGDFENHYRFMSTEVVNEKIKPLNFRGAAYIIQFTPSMSSIQRLKFQAQANNEEPTVQVSTKDGDLLFSFGDASTHAGSFVFEPSVNGTLKNTWSWPIQQLMNILNLPGSVVMRVSDEGALEINVDSGIVDYRYILPAMTK
jgi:hypothetical protein